jgi:hypothetical protein
MFDITCFLERDFPIAFHGPKIPLEILASGSCLLCSKEIVEKQWFKAKFVDQRNIIIIGNPKDRQVLSSKLEKSIINKRDTFLIGQRGRLLAKYLDNKINSSFIELINRLKL